MGPVSSVIRNQSFVSVIRVCYAESIDKTTDERPGLFRGLHRTHRLGLKE